MFNPVFNHQPQFGPNQGVSAMSPLMGADFNQQMLANQGLPGLMQGGSLGLPVPGGLDHTNPNDPWPTYLSPGATDPTAPFLPYTPPQADNIGLTGFDEIDLAAYQGMLERLMPERLEDPYAGLGVPNTMAGPAPAPPTSAGYVPGGAPAPAPAPAPAVMAQPAPRRRAAHYHITGRDVPYADLSSRDKRRWKAFKDGGMGALNALELDWAIEASNQERSEGAGGQGRD